MASGRAPRRLKSVLLLREIAVCESFDRRGFSCPSRSFVTPEWTLASLLIDSRLRIRVHSSLSSLNFARLRPVSTVAYVYLFIFIYKVSEACEISRTRVFLSTRDSRWVERSRAHLDARKKSFIARLL